MKKYVIIFILALAACFFVGCKAEYTTYKGAEYVSFADTLVTCPVLIDNPEFNITVTSTKSCDYDRTFGIEVIDKGSTAIERYHYQLPSNTVTIKAGERTAKFPIKGYYDNFNQLGKVDSVGVVLQLVAPEEVKWELYGQSQQVKVVFTKCCPFDINDFSGYCVVSSTLLYSYTDSGLNRLVKTEIDPDNENTVIIRDWLFDGDTYRNNYDAKLHFDTTNPLEPKLELVGDEVICGNIRSLMGYPHGDGWITTYTSPGYISYFNVCQNYAFLYHFCYVTNTGALGTFVSMFEWVSDEEAERIMREGF